MGLCEQSLTQEPGIPPRTEEMIVSESEDQDEENDRLQQLHAFSKNPLDLNQASAEEMQILGLNAFQITALIEHRKRFGDLIAIQELQAIKGWDLRTIRELLPYVTIGQSGANREHIQNGWKKGNHFILFRSTRILEKAKGFLKSTVAPVYEGSPQKTLLRYQYRTESGIQGGFTAEKDAGEKFFVSGRKFGFDFTSAHLQIRKIGMLQMLVAGDYKIQMGQGLILWQGNGFRKGAGSLLVKRQGPLLLPYSGAGEFLFLRGIGAEFGIKRWKLLTFFSARKLSASLDINLQGEEQITTVLQSGLHRSVTELEKRNNVQFRAFGVSARYHFSNGHISLNTVQHLFSLSFAASTRPYALFQFKGNTISNASLDYTFTRNNFHTSGEWAVDQSGKVAMVNSIMIALDSKLDLVLLHRHFQKSYSSFQSNAFADQPVPKNESGLYTGISLRPNKVWQLDAYADLALFPWLKFRADAPSAAAGYNFLLRYTPSRKAEWYVRYKKELTASNVQARVDDHFNSIMYISASSLRLHLGLQLNREWTVRQRFEMTRVGNPGENAAYFGSLYYAEAFYKPSSANSSYNFRIMLFNTDGYDARIYSYEQDVLFNASVPAVDGKGIRYYFNFHRRLRLPVFIYKGRGDVYLKWSQTIYMDKKTIGSGMDEIQGNHKSAINIQLLLSFG